MKSFFSVRAIPALMALWFLVSTASAGDFKVKVQLAWGSDGAKPAEKDVKELDSKVKEKLRHFRWKNYWVLKSDSATATSKGGTEVVLDKCRVELKTLTNGHLEVKLYSLRQGSPKLVKTVHHAMRALKDGELCILAGDDKDSWDSAWLVIISGE